MHSLLATLGPHVATFIVAFLSGLLPFINIEIFLVAAAAIASASSPVWPLGVVAAVGQLAAKTLLYRGAAAGLDSRAGRRVSPERLAALRLRMSEMNPWILGGFNLFSAFSGVPPFFVVSVLAGAVRMRFWQFLLTGLAGRTARLVLMVEFPHVIKGMLR
jgi:membrane protein YqaA with SNARE-associated domain